MPNPTADVSNAKPEEGSLELTENIIRERAYQFYTDWGVHLTPVSTTGCGFAFVLLSHCLNPL